MKLSMVTVCYNAENCIDKTIQSVLTQSMKVYEYIVVDGNSDDATYDKICSYDKQFEERGIQYHHFSEKDKGISDAFNKGISYATGDVVGLINADDELLPDTCAILDDYFKKEDADVLYGNCIWVDEKRQIEYIKKPKTDLSKLLYNMVLIHPSTFIKRTAYLDCGMYDITYRFCMDKELLYRMYREGKKFVFVDACLSKFKAGGVSDTHLYDVCKEGSRLALQYGEPWIKVKIIERYKIIRNIFIDKIKNTSIFRIVRKDKENNI